MLKLLIKDIAERQGLNRSQLQRRSGVTLPMLYRYWDNETESVHLKSIVLIAKALGVDVRDLFIYESEEEEEEAAPKQESVIVTNTVVPIDTPAVPASKSRSQQKAKKQERVTSPSEMPVVKTSRLPAYQIFIKHAPGPCSTLPVNFAYRDLHKSVQQQQCPVHCVFERQCSINQARQAVEQLKQEVDGIIKVMLDKNGYPLQRDAWEQNGGRWSSVL